MSFSTSAVVLLFAICFWSLILGIVFWIIPPLRRWTFRWPVILMALIGVLLIGGAVALSGLEVDVYVFSPMLIAGFALQPICGAALVVRAFEWYLWAYWR
jgi:hypothetical protein